MANELTEFEREQLVSKGPCNLHTHEVNLNEHKHVVSLQALEVVVTVTANHVADYREDIILVDTSAGNVTITLPPSRGGKKFYILKTKAANAVTVQFTGGETLLGAASYSLSAQAEGRWFKGVYEGYIPL